MEEPVYIKYGEFHISFGEIISVVSINDGKSIVVSNPIFPIYSDITDEDMEKDIARRIVEKVLYDIMNERITI